MCRSRATAASKSSPMDCRSGMALNRPSTPPSSTQSRGQARRSQGLTRSQARRLSGLPVARDAKRTPSLCAPVAAAWWSLASRSAADSTRRPPRGYNCSQATGHLRPPLPCSLRHGPRGSWSGLLAVTTQSAFAASLELPLAGERNVGGEARSPG